MRNRTIRTSVATAILAGPLFLACENGLGPDGSAPHPDDIGMEWRGHVPADGLVEIKGVIGKIEVAPSQHDEVMVTVSKHGIDDDPGLVRVVLLEHADASGVTICAVYPTVAGHRENECGVESEGNLSADDSDVSVDFSIQLPIGVHISANTVNGDVIVEGVDSDVAATAVNGSIQISTARFAKASTVNGQVDVELAGAPVDRDREFAAVNGNILLSVTAAADADYVATTVNGTLRSSFDPVFETGSHIMRGKIGDGGPLLSITTVNGNITLRELMP